MGISLLFLENNTEMFWLFTLYFLPWYVGWSEPAATNAPVQDEPVEAV
jgi:hypothetical protein